MNNTGYIKLHRKILDWEWYKHTNTRILFLHLLISANWEDSYQNGHMIQRGQLLTTVKELSTINQQTTQQTKTALKHLVSTNEITIKATPKFSIITVNNYDVYQSSNKQNSNHTSNNQQAVQQTVCAENNKPTLLYKELRNQETEEEKNTEPCSETSVFVNSVIQDFNTICTSLSPIHISDTKAKAILNARPHLYETSFADYFRKVEASDFLTNRTGRSFAATFDWLMKPENIDKVLSGHYDVAYGDTTQTKRKQSTSLDDYYFEPSKGFRE